MRLTLGTSPPSSTSSSSRIYLLRCAFPRAPGGGDRSRRLNRHTPSITVSLVSLSLSLSLPPFYRRHVRQCGAENNHHRHRRNVFNSNSASRKKREERWSPGMAKVGFDSSAHIRRRERERGRGAAPTPSTPSAGIWQVTALVASVPSCSNARGPTITVQSM